MFRLASILYSLIATTLAGTAVIAVLTIGYDTLVRAIAFDLRSGQAVENAT
jgi:hypothetical protein